MPERQAAPGRAWVLERVWALAPAQVLARALARAWVSEPVPVLQWAWVAQQALALALEPARALERARWVLPARVMAPVPASPARAGWRPVAFLKASLRPPCHHHMP